jgi:hypothetical protein
MDARLDRSPPNDLRARFACGKENSNTMEEYAQLLICADRGLVPTASQISALYKQLQSKHGFRFVVRPPFEPGILIITPSDKPRIARNQFTGEEISLPGLDRKFLNSVDEIPGTAAEKKHYTVRVNGEWSKSDLPIELRSIDGSPIEGGFICAVECAVRSEAVCTSSFEFESEAAQGPLTFDDPKSPVESLGIYQNPWNLSRMEVPGAGSARFWISFEFGKWLFPDLKDGFNLLEPLLVADAEGSFGVRFFQAGRGF